MVCSGPDAAAIRTIPAKEAGSAAKKRDRGSDTQADWRAAAVERRKERQVDGGLDAAGLSAVIAGKYSPSSMCRMQSLGQL
jgi:hypothetical protein